MFGKWSKRVFLIVVLLILYRVFIRGGREFFQALTASLTPLLTTSNSALASTSSCTDVSVAPFVTGMIMIWSGSENAIPAGWVLCNGAGGTPDLRGRFVLGVNPTTSPVAGLTPVNVRATGGEERVTLTVGQMPKHSHQYSQGGRYAVCSGCSGHAVGDNPEERQTWKTTNAAGNNQPHDNMPPYYVLAYVMKT